jgi:ribonuclease-3
MEKLQKKINLKFKNHDLYELAFVHRSYLNENKNTKEHNERIEFL